MRETVIDAGISARPWLGTEAVARLLGFRINHPREDDDLELEVTDPITRAEAAYSIARYLGLTGDQIEAVRTEADAFALPPLSEWQRVVLDRALRFVGYPYVWAGTSDKPQRLFGKVLPGGFDCSGFVWRVYKLQAYPGGAALSTTIKGRTTYQMSGEVPKAKRISFAKLQPADLVFFGPKGPSSTPASVGHTGIYLGNGWMIHSSGQGVAVTPMTGWYRTQFAWGRRPLAEAGLTAAR